MKNKQTPDERLIEASKCYRVNNNGELERTSWPYKSMGRQPSIGVGFDHSNNCKYKHFNHRLHKGGDRLAIKSHRMVFYLTHGYLPQQVDHIDNDRSNNHPNNLRAATPSQNQRNKSPRKNATSKYLGVCWNRHRGKWQAQIRAHGKNTHISLHNREIEAAKAYDAKAREFYGEFANPNFPL